jgi:hypothetical protein
MMPALFKAVLPSTTLGRLLLLLNVAFAVALYIWVYELLGRQGGRVIGMDFIYMFFAFVFLSAFSLLYLIFRRHPVPLLGLAAGIAIALRVPPPPSLEERVFAAHRAELEELVELARKRQLARETPDGECGAGNHFVVPEEYKYFIASECLRIGGREETLYVEIWPYWDYDALIYSADPLPIFGACGDHYRDGEPKQLDEHWFLCQRDRG